MLSPLPDSSALEAGIIEDELPSRLSRLQENVRTLLRNSSFGLPSTAPPASTFDHTFLTHGLPTPPDSPAHPRSPHTVEELPNPLGANPPSIASPAHAGDMSGTGIPPSHYREAVQHMAHQSTLFNSRAVAALNHPDLSDPSLVEHLRKAEHRQRRSWKRSRQVKRSRAVEGGPPQRFLCVLTALLLAALVGTYIILATTTDNKSPTFHILFVLGIILATIVFAYSLGRLLLFQHSHKSRTRAPTNRHKARHRSNSNPDRRQRRMPTHLDELITFVPSRPIPVHMPTDEVRPDSRNARPTATVQVSSEAGRSWNKPVNVRNPPPAYGRWRGSVRADPDLLHWQVVPSPVVPPVTPGLPSPMYEEAVARPPSYVTRNSPARQREMQEQAAAAEYQSATVELEPEMFEVQGVGIAV